MAHNPVQFPKGLSLSEFYQRYGNEDQCHAALVTMRWPDGFSCPQCGGKKHSYARARRLFQCSACRRQTSARAGTIFQQSKTPLVKWFLAIYLLTQAKNDVPVLELARQLGVKEDTARQVKQKLTEAKPDRGTRYKLDGDSIEDDVNLCGEKPGDTDRKNANSAPQVCRLTTARRTQSGTSGKSGSLKLGQTIRRPGPTITKFSRLTIAVLLPAMLVGVVMIGTRLDAIAAFVRGAEYSVHMQESLASNERATLDLGFNVPEPEGHVIKTDVQMTPGVRLVVDVCAMGWHIMDHCRLSADEEQPVQALTAKMCSYAHPSHASKRLSLLDSQYSVNRRGEHRIDKSPSSCARRSSQLHDLAEQLAKFCKTDPSCSINEATN